MSKIFHRLWKNFHTLGDVEIFHTMPKKVGHADWSTSERKKRRGEGLASAVPRSEGGPKAQKPRGLRLQGAPCCASDCLGRPVPRCQAATADPVYRFHGRRPRTSDAWSMGASGLQPPDPSRGVAHAARGTHGANASDGAWKGEAAKRLGNGEVLPSLGGGAGSPFWAQRHNCAPHTAVTAKRGSA